MTFTIAELRDVLVTCRDVGYINEGAGQRIINLIKNKRGYAT